MKIALVTPRYSPDVGGVENHVERLAARAVQQGHTVDVITQGRQPTSFSEEVDGVMVRRFALTLHSPHYALAAGLVSYLRRYVRSYDVVHGHNYHALPALAAALNGPRAFVFTPHYHGTSESMIRRGLHRLYRPTGRALVKRATRVICVSRREAALIERDFPASRDRLRVIGNGVDRCAIDTAAPHREPGCVILSAGRLAGYKGVDRIIEAFTELGNEYCLRITGEGDEAVRLMATVTALGLDSRVSFLGHVSREELLRWFKTARVFVTMSRIEAMPLTPLEVLAAGACVVASDIDAHREIADTTRGSVELIPVQASPSEIASAITRAAARAPTPPRLMDWDEVGDQTLTVYEEALR